MDRLDLTDAVDLHTHVGPSSFDRRVDGYECALEVANAGMGGVVMKEHHLPTVYGVPYIEQLLDAADVTVEVFGSVVLNYCNGGFNPFVVESALQHGAAAVWAPTIDARHHADQTGQLGAFLGVEAGEEYEGAEGIVALDDNGDLRDDVRLCLDKVVAHDALFCVGHLSFAETREIVSYLADANHEKIIVDHPNYRVTDLNLDQQHELVSLGATLNVPFMAISPKYHWIDATTIADNIRDVGVDNCVLTSDVGQVTNPSVPESLRIFGETLRSEGLSAAEIRQMLVDTPRTMVDLFE
jgi:hypothetical protein